MMVAHCKDEPKRLRPMTTSAIYDALGEIVLLASKLRGPQSHNPNAFHEDKSDLINAIGKLREGVRLGVRT